MSLTINIITIVIVASLIVWNVFRAASVKPINPKFILPSKTQRKKQVKSKTKSKPVMNDVQKAAKSQLVSLGFAATEAKKMLEGIKASTVEQYVKEAMKRINV